MIPTKADEEKKRLIDRLWMEREALLAKAVENCAGSHLANGILFLDYQHPLHKAWAKILTSGKMPRLKAVAKQIGIAVEVLS
ncbi:MAG: hypothetical protein WAM44_20395 [Chthoniobacterales bacterium]